MKIFTLTAIFLTLVYGCKKADEATLPVLTTGNISAITLNSAVIGGTMTSDGGGALTARGICYGNNSNPTILDKVISDGGKESNTFSCTLTGLTRSTKYYVRAFATNKVGTSYGDEISFSTSMSMPGITTAALVSSINTTTATVGGTVTDDGGGTLTAWGICYGNNFNPTILDKVISAQGVESGAFSCTLTGLTRATKYYARAYATNSVGTSYGNEISFSTTMLLPGITTTESVSSITTTTATIGGTVTDDGGGILSARGVCWSIDNNLPTIANDKTTDGTVTGIFTSMLTGLAMTTTYYVRAYATNSAGTSYGATISFTTKGLPLLTTAALSNFIGTQATSGSVVTNEGGFTILNRGVCWSTGANPTLANNYVQGGLVNVLINLIPGTVYHVRAFATNSVGTAYGNDLSFNSGQILGNTHAGGLVVFNNGMGGGLVCSASDVSAGAPWGCRGTFITLTNTGFGTGGANTISIVNNCSTAGTAARLCNDLTLGNYSDWFLPSTDEMMRVWTIIPIVSGSNYWTSSEYDTYSAYGIVESYGSVYSSHYGDKSSLFKVRAVRVF